MRAMKTLIAAQYNGIAIELPTFRFGIDNKKPEFKAISPLGKIPVLETPQGPLFESNAIARYVAGLRLDTELLGSSYFESAQVDSWLAFCSNELEIPAGMWVYPVLGYMPNNPEVTSKAQGDLKKALAVMDKHLATRTYMVGRHVTLADIVLVSALYYPMKLVLDTKARKAFQNVDRWFHTCVNQPAFKAVLGEFTACTKAEVAPGAPAAAAPKKEKKQAAPKKEKKKEAAPAAPQQKKKAAHPLALLPKSSFVMDAWKKMYSNNNIVDVAMPWFFENIDKEGYSVWFHDYNYNSENTVGFMTNNLVTGFMERCDGIRKFCFGMIHIFGDDSSKEYPVAGCWLMRGDSIEHMLEANPDAEYHTWTKANLDDEADRAKISAIWACNADGGRGVDEEVMGKKVFDYQCFK
jgi:elongation factor 1-gamma